GAPGAAPVVLADARGERGHAGLGAHPEAEAEAVAGARQVELAAVDAAAEMVARHEPEGGGPEDAGVVELAAGDQHLREAGVVARGAGEAAAGRFHLRGYARVVEIHAGADGPVIREGLGDALLGRACG